ncbi:MAG: hypothetical protein QW273_02075 [Candidatus Pacearchaeota archaeon]
MKTTKGISETVVIIFVILISIVSIGLFSITVFPIIKKSPISEVPCSLALRDLSIDVESGYTCFNYSDSSFIVRVKKRSEDVNYTGVKFSLLYKNRDPIFIKFSESFEKNSFKVFKIQNVQDRKNLVGLELYPIIKIENEEKECPLSSRITLDDSSFYCEKFIFGRTLEEYEEYEKQKERERREEEIKSLFAGGKGTPTDPFQIENCQQLQNIKYALDSHFILNNDIDCSETRNWNNGKGFEPLGNSSSPFNGSFNGNGKNISNIFINRSTESYVGLFGYANNSKIYNLQIEGKVIGFSSVGFILGSGSFSNITSTKIKGEINGLAFVGGIIGYSLGGIRLENVSFEGEINSSNFAGGLIGYGREFLINFSYANATLISNGNNLGGLIGFHSSNLQNSSIVLSSYSLGQIIGKNSIGGFIGYSEGNLTVSDCYSRTKVIGESNIGGFIGTLNNLSFSTSEGSGEDSPLVIEVGRIQKSYSAGFVSGSSNVGGFIGEFSGGEILSSFFDVDSSKETDACGKGNCPSGIQGKTTEEMKNILIYEDAGWDIEIDLTSSLNDGYPYLGWQEGNKEHVWFITLT